MPRRPRPSAMQSSRPSVRPGSIRLISGQWKGRKLPVLDAEGLRPTTDRVKETLFNWLAAEIRDAHCLDLFAGSGSLGFEALSRYAAHVTMVEFNRSVAQQLIKNLNTLGSRDAEIIHQDARVFLSQPAIPQDVVFLDPPFNKGFIEDICQRLENGGWLKEHAFIYIERELNGDLFTYPSNWNLIKDKKAGQVSYQLYQREGINI